MFSLLPRGQSPLSALGPVPRISTPSIGHVRCYAAKNKTAVTQRQGFRPKQKDGAGGLAPVKREKRLGAFRPLAPAQLQDQLFQSDRRTELQLPTFRPEALTESAIGKAMSFSVSDKDAIRIYGVPKNLLVEFRLLSKPCSVIRDVTLTAADKLDSASEKPSRESRVVLTGPSGSGKSFTLLQAVEYCVAKNWVVLYVPRALNLVDSSTPYSYDSRTRTYLQPTFSYQLLQRFLTVNSGPLRDLSLQKDVVLDRRTLPAGTSYVELLEIGLKEQTLAPTVLAALFAELSLQKTHPVLLAVDDFQALYRHTSSYRNPRFEGIKTYHLSIPRLLLEFASGKKSFARGAVFGALSTANTEFCLPLELQEALGLSPDRPIGPYEKRFPQLVEYAQGLQNLPVPPRLHLNEAASLFEVWMQDKALHTIPNDEMFMAKYSEAQGNPRDFVWKGLLSTLTS